MLSFVCEGGFEMTKIVTKSIFTVAGLAVALTVGVPASQAADILDKITDRSKIVVCTNVNNPPLVFLEPSGAAKGMQIDLLDDFIGRLSKKLGKKVEVELIAVLPANRVQFLQQGKCDILFTSLTVTEERKKLVWFVEPYYYAAGPGLLSKKGTVVKRWEDIKGKPICSNQGSSWNLPVEQKYGGTIVAFQTQQEVDQSLRDGRCIALVSDDSYLQARMLTDTAGHWKDYFIQDLEPFTEGPWGLAIRFDERRFYDFISDTIKDWNKKGTIVDAAKKWKLKPAQLALKAHADAKK